MSGTKKIKIGGKRLKMDDQIVVKTEIEGVFLIKRPTYPDERGSFHEVFRLNELEEVLGQKINIVQANHSVSQRGVLRGIHVAKEYSKIDYSTNKIQQVVVDLRKDSPTFKKSISVIFGDGTAIFIPPMCGNAFQALEDNASYFYFVTDYWTKEKELEVLWSDPELDIDWQINPPAFLSKRDSNVPTLKQLLEEGKL